MLIERAIEAIVQSIEQIPRHKHFISRRIESQFDVDIVVSHLYIERFVVDSSENHLIGAVKELQHLVFDDVRVRIRANILYANGYSRKHLFDYALNFLFAFLVESAHLECGNNKLNDQLSLLFVVGCGIQFEHRELTFALYRKFFKKLRRHKNLLSFA